MYIIKLMYPDKTCAFLVDNKGDLGIFDSLNYPIKTFDTKEEALKTWKESGESERLHEVYKRHQVLFKIVLAQLEDVEEIENLPVEG